MNFTRERQLALAHSVQDALKALKALERRVWAKETGLLAAKQFDSDNLLTLASFIHGECESLRSSEDDN